VAPNKQQKTHSKETEATTEKTDRALDIAFYDVTQPGNGAGRFNPDPTRGPSTGGRIGQSTVAVCV